MDGDLNMDGWGDEEVVKPKQAPVPTPVNPTLVRKGLVVLLYGDTGSGKTYTSMSFPEPIFILDTESRCDIVKKYNFPGKSITIKTPVELKDEFDSKDVDILDTHKTIENITEEIIQYANKLKSGEIKGGTFILDSVTDIWTFVQDWGIHELAKYSDSKGNPKANVMLMRVNNQVDWRLINKKYAEIVGLLRLLALKHGVNVVLTARNQSPPDYISNREGSEMKDRVRAQKDTPFYVDFIFRLKPPMEIQGKMHRVAICEKLGGLEFTNGTIENLTYDKIMEMIKNGETALSKR